LGNIAYFEVLSTERASVVIPLTALYPLVTVILAVVLLRERFNIIQLSGILCSVFAVYCLTITNDKDWFSQWPVIVFVPILMWGVAGLLQKISTNHVSGESSTFWFVIGFIAVAFGIMTREAFPGGISARVWMLAFAVGFTLALGNYAVLVAFASGGKASIITPVTSLYPLISIALAIVLLGERLSQREALGIVLATTAVFFLACESRPSPTSSAALETESI
jgi:drug/metabolite transporter (DMT)-like permease